MILYIEILFNKKAIFQVGMGDDYLLVLNASLLPISPNTTSILKELKALPHWNLCVKTDSLEACAAWDEGGKLGHKVHRIYGRHLLISKVETNSKPKKTLLDYQHGLSAYVWEGRWEAGEPEEEEERARERWGRGERKKRGGGRRERTQKQILFFVFFFLFYFGAWYLEFTVEVISNQIAFNPGTMYSLSAWTLVGYGANSLQVEMEDIKLTSIRST